MSNVIYKTVNGSRNGQWKQVAEEHASNGVAFLIRPFHKEHHWEFLQDLCKRYDFEPKFRAVDRSASFEPRSKNE